MFLTTPQATEAAERLYESDREGHGFVMNLTRLWAWRPDVYQAFVALRAQLVRDSTLTPREVAIVVCATVSTADCAYCSLAWGARLAKATGEAIAGAVLRGTDEGLGARERALAQWARKATRGPSATTAADVQALRDAGVTDKEIFEATCLIAFRMAFSAINGALGAQPDAQLAAEAPQAVREVVTYGRPVDASQR